MPPAIRARPDLDLLLDPDLTVLVFRRGWTSPDFDAWAARFLETGAAFVMPTHVDTPPAARLVTLNPRAILADSELVIGEME